jgi:signal peptide peptidase SppA
MKDYSNIIAELNGSHWLMREESLHQMADVIQDIELGTVIDAKARHGQEDDNDPIDRMFEVQDGTAVVPVRGKIMPRANLMTMMSGGVSVEMLGETVKRLDEREDVNRVVFDFDSPGGSATGLTNLANRIRNMKTETVAFASGGMYSAAYYFGSAADKLFVSPNGGVGSIGVYTMLVSRAKQNEMMGLDVRVIRSTPMKGKGNPAEPIDEETVNKYQRQVDQLHTEFIRVVAENRGLDEDFVRENMADASVVMGNDAQGTSFVDGVMTRDQVFDSFTESLNTNTNNHNDMDFTEQELAELSEAFDADVEDSADVVRLSKELAADLDQAQSELASVRTAFDQYKENAQANEVDRMITEAIEQDKKFPPAKRETLETLAEENGIEALETTISLVDNGSAAPKQMSETVEAPEESQDEKIQAARAEGKAVAMDDDEAEFYKTAGKDFVHVEDL